MSENLPALPAPALKRMPTGNVYFSPQQMRDYALAARKAALEEAVTAVWDREDLARHDAELAANGWEDGFRYGIQEAHSILAALKDAE